MCKGAIMADINTCTFSGNLTRDPEIKYVDGGGKAVAKFAIAVNGYKDGDVMYLDCDVWERKAEVANQYLYKGAPTVVTGRLTMREYVTKDGDKKKAVTLIVSDFKLPPKKDGASSGGQSRSTQQARQSDATQGRSEYGDSISSGEGGAGFGDDLDGEIPFNEDPREYRQALSSM